ncbi:MAG: DUF6789 family protein [Thermomicrobiales bacterium]
MMQRDVQAIVDGALGGAIGTAAMSAVMAVGAKLGLLGTAPPETIAAQALAAVGIRRRKEEAQDVLTVVGHVGFGIAIGALFAVLHRRLRLPIPPAIHGIVFATIVWVVSYKGWVPALGLMPPPERDRPSRPATMLVAHWVFGWTLGAIVGRR